MRPIAQNFFLHSPYMSTEVASMDLMTADGFSKAKVGVLRRAAQPDIVVYDYERCVAILQEREGWTEEEAVDWIEYNTLGSWLGEGTPGFLVKE